MLPEYRDPTVRHAVRLIMLDDLDRLLLFSGIDSTDGAAFWYPIGGGPSPAPITLAH
ncbi:hypothetical protein ACIA5E_04785 [Nocardia asteroides]|uniref:hypothetical protein n=1 Tax=Nocardia asteroides TaxID=1824 RepID=UPI0037BB2630